MTIAHHNTSSALMSRRASSSKGSADVKIEPGPLDILWGRNRIAQQNLGNQRFRAIIVLSFVHYGAASTRALKSKLVKSVMEDLMSVGARFIKYENGDWSIIDEERVICDKIGHALRAHSAVHHHMIVQAERFMRNYSFQCKHNGEHIFDAKQESYHVSPSEHHIGLRRDPQGGLRSCYQATTANCTQLSLVRSQGRLIFPFQSGKEQNEDSLTIPLKPAPLTNNAKTMHEGEYISNSPTLQNRVLDPNNCKAPSFRDESLFAVYTATPLKETMSYIERGLQEFEQCFEERLSIEYSDAVL
jgi:hypothetical protein